jgi:ribosomal-protein-alanine N-acetyltransferase
MSGSQFFLHESNAGYYCVKLIDDIAEFLSIGVSPQLQGQGIGFVMCSHMIEHCKINGVQKIFLEVSVQNFKAISLYKKLGFFVIDLRKQYYNDGMDAYTMQLTLGLF